MKSFSFSLILEYEIQSSPIEKNSHMKYSKKLTKPYQVQKEDFKRIKVLFNVMQPFLFKYGLSFRWQKDSIFNIWQLKGDDKWIWKCLWFQSCICFTTYDISTYQ